MAGTLDCGQTAEDTGTNVGSSIGWWMITFTGSCAEGAINLSGTNGDIMDLYEGSVSGTPQATGITGADDLSAGTYYVAVYEGPAGTDGNYTLNFANNGT